MSKAEETEKKEESKDSNNSNEYEDICYICRRPESIAGKMINIYGGVKICTDCMQRTMDSMNSGAFGMPPGMGFGMADLFGVPGAGNKLVTGGFSPSG